MTVSICVSVYGVEKYIERCAKSLLEQTYKAIEYIFVDDCSPDESIQVLSRFLDNYPERKKCVRIIRHEKNRGLAAARNTAVEHATGEFIMHVDSDDYIDTNTVEECMKQQMVGDDDIVSFDIVYHRKSYDTFFTQPDFIDSKDMTRKMLSRRAFHGVVGHLMKRSLYADHQVKAVEGINMSEDFLVIPQLTYYAKKVSNLHSFFYHYDCTNLQSYSNTFSRAKAEQQLAANSELTKFFKNKGDEYIELLRVEYIKCVLRHLKDSLLAGDVEYYNMSVKRLDECDKSFIKKVRMRDRLPYMINNILINRCYLGMGRFTMAKYKRLKAFVCNKPKAV